jgi:phosphoadenosine phosphosulfate reductase
MTVQTDVANLQKTLRGRTARDVISTIVHDAFPGRVAVACSFGTEAAALLHLLASVDATVPVLFIDTGRHFEETLRYRNELAARFGLTDVRSIGPSPDEIAFEDPDSTRFSSDPNGCCAFRKVVPLKRALAGFDAWVTGLMPFQAKTRSALSLVEADGPRVKVNPLVAWTAEDVEAYERLHALPQHPLVARGYLSIGCAPCTTRVKPGEDPRAGRWRGLGKTECGLHPLRSQKVDAQCPA